MSSGLPVSPPLEFQNPVQSNGQQANRKSLWMGNQRENGPRLPCEHRAQGKVRRWRCISLGKAESSLLEKGQQ